LTANSPSIVNPTISNLVEGTYVIELKVTDSQGLNDLDSMSITVRNQENKKTVFYPNPTKQSVFIKIQNQYSGEINISVDDLVGKRLHQYSINKNSEILTHEAKLNLLSSGVYFIHIGMGNTIETIKVMKY
jgi:type IX secretion system substrate protein